MLTTNYLGTLLCLFFVFFSLESEAQLDNSLKEFWNAEKNSQRKKASKKIRQLNPDFDLLFKKLEQGKVYPKDVSTGFVEWTYQLDSLPFYCLVFIPHNYDPKKKYAVHFYLHGGVSTLNPRFIDSRIDRNDLNYQTRDYISVYPAGWTKARWWDMPQFKNLAYLRERLKRTYNTDENKFYLKGVSDGATGLYALSNQDITPWACFTPFIGNIRLLNELSYDVYFSNWKNRPFFIVNTEKDELFPIEKQKPYIEQLQEVNLKVQFYIPKNKRHELSWYPAYREQIETFFDENTRNPYPDSLYWATSSAQKNNRNHWLVITKLSKQKKNAKELTTNTLANGEQAFKRSKSFGEIALVKNGNTVRVNTQGVKNYTLLISPTHFDLKQPIEVYTNGKLSFEGKVKKRVETLLYYAKNDQDRTMLFANALEIVVK